LSLENSTNRMVRLGREMLNLGSVQEIDHILKTVHAINEKNVNALIPAYLDIKKQTYAFVGPLTTEEARDIFKIGI
jgi:predicted Zn-dependent peptidase